VIGGAFQSKELPVARIAPDRRWFGNARTVSQTQLSEFRDALAKSSRDPYSVLTKVSKVPFGLLTEKSDGKAAKASLLAATPYESIIGKKGPKRKRLQLSVSSIESLATKATADSSTFEAAAEAAGPAARRSVASSASSTQALKAAANQATSAGYGFDRDKKSDDLFAKGQSKRIWTELYKVIDSSDVLIQVLDARDPMGTRSYRIEKQLRENHRTKHMILLLNKADLVPTWATKRWIKILSREYPTIAFHSSLTKPFGRESLTKVLQQFAALHKHRPQISVGFIGYPNVGKSSVINTLRRKNVCNVAPVPGETRVWQYITLFKRVYLIDCPGVVTPTGDFDDDVAVLRGVVRVEKLRDPLMHLPALMDRVDHAVLAEMYGLPPRATKDADTFAEAYARRMGRLIKGGEANVGAAARMILTDFQRGKIPYFVRPPFEDDEEAAASAKRDQEAKRAAEEQAEFQRQFPGAKLVNADDALPSVVDARNRIDTDRVEQRRRSRRIRALNSQAATTRAAGAKASNGAKEELLTTLLVDDASGDEDEAQLRATF